MGNIPGNGYVFGKNAPRKDMAFPAQGNMTAAEILAFFPYWLRCCDVVFRLVANGMTQKTAAIMVNHYREFPNHPTTSNTVYKMMSSVMRSYGYENWIPMEHHRLVPDMWPKDRIDIGEFLVEAQDFPERHMSRKGVITSIPFKDLKKDVRCVPEGDDALDLTRCVLYAVDHPDEEWLYPQDFDRLTQLLGGPMPVKQENSDGAVFERWSKVQGFHQKKYAPKKKRARKETKDKKQVKKQKVEATEPEPSFLNYQMDGQGDDEMSSDGASAAPGRSGQDKQSSPLLAAAEANDMDPFLTPGNHSMQPHSTAPYYVRLPSPLQPSSLCNAATPSPEVQPHEYAPPMSHLQYPPPPSQPFRFYCPYPSVGPHTSPLVEVDTNTAVQHPGPSARSKMPNKMMDEWLENLDSNSPPSYATFTSPLPSVGDFLQDIVPPGSGVPNGWTNHVFSDAANNVAPDSSPPVQFMQTQDHIEAFKNRPAPPHVEPPLTTSLPPVLSPIPGFSPFGAPAFYFPPQPPTTYSPYDYQGPRTEPPFRSLHLLTDPSPNDFSDFAESIRWVKQQWEAYHETRWNESPEHLAAISQAMRSRHWMSVAAFGTLVHTSQGDMFDMHAHFD